MGLARLDNLPRLQCLFIISHNPLRHPLLRRMDARTVVPRQTSAHVRRKEDRIFRRRRTVAFDDYSRSCRRIGVGVRHRQDRYQRYLRWIRSWSVRFEFQESLDIDDLE